MWELAFLTMWNSYRACRSLTCKLMHNEIRGSIHFLTWRRSVCVSLMSVWKIETVGEKAWSLPVLHWCQTSQLRNKCWQSYTLVLLCELHTVLVGSLLRAPVLVMDCCIQWKNLYIWKAVLLSVMLKSIVIWMNTMLLCPLKWMAHLLWLKTQKCWFWLVGVRSMSVSTFISRQWDHPIMFSLYMRWNYLCYDCPFIA